MLDFLEKMKEALFLDIEAGERTIYAYRTNEQLRASQFGRMLQSMSKAAGGFAGPYRAAVFAVWREMQSKEIDVELVFSSTPDVGE